ncbi:hypothetical protein LCGC14_2735860 [marine sediment metagenome]|uniref:Uncharacterized protein n=1 Tax=marine sediment metagenome TaxID=412755 RepID=A0A0F9BXJ5_9ZZZZ
MNHYEKGILNKEADKLGRRPKTTIDKQLADDLVRWRDFLNDNIASWNPKIEKNKIFSAVLNRSR